MAFLPVAPAFCPRRNAGGGRHDLQISAGRFAWRISRLHRWVEREDDGDLRSARPHHAPVAASPATARRSSAVRSQWTDDSRFARARRQALRALERNDDAEDALEYFRTSRPRRPAALHLLRRLRRSGITGRPYPSREARGPGHARSGRAAPTAGLPDRAIPIQRPRLARIDRALREAARAEKDRARARRYAGSVVDARAVGSGVAGIGGHRASAGGGDGIVNGDWPPGKLDRFKRSSSERGLRR